MIKPSVLLKKTQIQCCWWFLYVKLSIIVESVIQNERAWCIIKIKVI